MRRRVLFFVPLSGWLTMASATPVMAGMPSPTLSDWAEIRLETISFFVAVILVGAALVRLLWNQLAKDFPNLPRLTYRRALGMIVLLGLFMIVLLTMIAAARELLTPGAWQKQGVLYRVAPPKSAESAESAKPRVADVPGLSTQHLSERFSKLLELQKKLWEYAAAHDGKFPPKTDAGLPAEIDPKLCAWPCVENMRYLYVPGRRVCKETEKTKSTEKTDSPRVLMYEPDVYDGDRLALRTDGKIVSLPAVELHQQLSEKP